MPASAIGRRLRALREERGWTQRELASRARVSYSYISSLERGGIPNPGIEKLRALAGAFGVAESALTNQAPDPPELIELDPRTYAALRRVLGLVLDEVLRSRGFTKPSGAE